MRARKRKEGREGGKKEGRKREGRKEEESKKGKEGKWKGEKEEERKEEGPHIYFAYSRHLTDNKKNSLKG